MNTIFGITDIDIYFLDFLDIKQFKNIMLLSKSSFEIVIKSKYYKELLLCQKLAKKIDIEDICEHGFLNLFKLYIRNIYLNIPYHLVCDGQKFMIKYSKTNQELSNAIRKTFEYSKLILIKYLIYLGLEIPNTKIFSIFYTSRTHFLQISKYLTYLGIVLNTTTFKIAIKNDCLNVIKYLLSINDSHYIRDNDYIKLASACGQLDIVKYFVSKNIDSDINKSIQIAAENGHLEIVKYLTILGSNIEINNNYPITWAAVNGHMNITKYLYYQNAKINANLNFVIEWVLINNHLEIINFMISNGIILDTYIYQCSKL